MNSEFIYSDIYNYDVPVFKISAKDGYSKVILNKVTLPTNYKNVNYNSNCVRWLRKVNIEGSTNPYFSTNAPENEFHLCSLYLPPGNYKSREEVISEINKQLKIVASNLFGQDNSVQNLYVEYRYSGVVPTKFSTTEMSPKNLEILYPNVTTTGKYRLLIKNLNEYGVSYSFDQPNTLILFRDVDIYNSLKLAISKNYVGSETIKDSISDFSMEYINGKEGNFKKLAEALFTYKIKLEKDVPEYNDIQYAEKRKLYDTYCTVIDSHRMNDVNYDSKDSMYEIYNGIVRSNAITSGINDGTLIYNSKTFDDLIWLIYDGKNGEVKSLNNEINYKINGETKSIIFGHIWYELGEVVFNLIHNLLLAYRESITNKISFKYTIDKLIETCIALNIHEIDKSFINNFVNLSSEDFIIEVNYFKELSHQWIARLLNQFIFHLIYGRINATNLSQYDLMHGISQHQITPQNDSVDWFTNKVIDLLKKLSEEYKEFDVYNDNWCFEDINSVGIKDNKENYSDFDANKVNLISYLISRIGEKNIPDLSSSLRLITQAYLLNSYIELTDNVINNQTIYQTYLDLKEANDHDAIPIESITYNLYNAGGVIKSTKGVSFKSTDTAAFNTLKSSNIQLETSDTYTIGKQVFSRLASDKDINLKLISGEANGVINKIINVGDAIELTVNGEIITIKKNEYLQLSGSSNNVSALKFHALFDTEHTAKSSLNERMDVVQLLSRETLFNESAGEITIENKDTTSLLTDPYFRDINDSSLTPFLVDAEAKYGLVSNIGKLLFVEPNQDVLPSTDNFSKQVYTIVNDRYSYNPDIYIYDSENKKLTKNTSAYKLFKYKERDSRISNRYYKRRENKVNVVTKIGLPFWKTDISNDNLYLLKLPNYTEVPFDGSLTPAYNMHTSDGKINLTAGTTCTSNLTPFIFNLFATEQSMFASEFSMLLPPMIYACAISNKDIEKVISRSDNSNQIYSFELDTTKHIFEFSNEVKLTIPENDSIYVFMSASEMPYSIPSGISRLDFDYVK